MTYPQAVLDQRAAVLSAVQDRYGIQLTETMTGGGCMALHARIESGHWLVAVDEGLCEFAYRIWSENDYDDHDDRRPHGWSLGIYPDAGEDQWFGQESICDVVDYDRYAEDLPDMVGRVLAELVKI